MKLRIVSINWENLVLQKFTFLTTTRYNIVCAKWRSKAPWPFKRPIWGLTAVLLSGSRNRSVEANNPAYTTLATFVTLTQTIYLHTKATILKLECSLKYFSTFQHLSRAYSQNASVPWCMNINIHFYSTNRRLANVKWKKKYCALYFCLSNC